MISWQIIWLVDWFMKVTIYNHNLPTKVNDNLATITVILELIVQSDFFYLPDWDSLPNELKWNRKKLKKVRFTPRPNLPSKAEAAEVLKTLEASTQYHHVFIELRFTQKNLSAVMISKKKAKMNLKKTAKQGQ